MSFVSRASLFISASSTLKSPQSAFMCWMEKKKEVVNPFEVGDIVIRTATGSNKIIKAFQVVKKTEKSVTIKPIVIEDNIPQINNFKIGLPERRTVKQDRENNFVVNHDDWYLYKYKNAL